MAKKKKNIKNKGNDKKKMISNFPSKKEEKAVVDGVVEYEEGITVDELLKRLVRHQQMLSRSYSC